MIEAASTAGEELASATRDPLRLGVAWDRTEWQLQHGIGPLGVRVAVVETDGQRTAYVLVDGNNMVPGLRDRIVETITTHPQRVTFAADGRGEGETTLDASIDAAEVMTTDTHVVNTVEATNQIGSAISHDALVDLIVRLTEAAVDDLEPVEAGMSTEHATVTVFGNDRTETLASHANAMTSMGSALAGTFILAVIAVSVLIFFFA